MSSTQAPRLDNRLAGGLTICATVGVASSTDALVKLLSGGYPIHQVNTVRCAVALVLTLGFLMYQRAWGELIGEKTGFMLVRGFVLAMGNLTFFLSIAAMPLADAAAIYFTMPFFVAGVVAPFLGERVRLHRWLAIAGGFVGVVIMTRPGQGVFEPAALLALASAFFYAVGQGMARPLGHQIKTSVTAFWQGVMYLAVAVLLALVFGTGAFDSEAHASLGFLTRAWIMPTAFDLSIMVALGVIGALLMPLFVHAYRMAEASFIAPFEYTVMFWAVIMGVLMFDEYPDLYTLGGGAVVVAAGLFMLRMDHKFRA